VLAIPAVAVLALLVRPRVRVPDPATYEPTTPPAPASGEGDVRPVIRWWVAMPHQFWIYSVFTAATMLGFATFGVLSFHMVARGLVPTAAVPLVYAAAMLAAALAALATGWAYDRLGPRVLIVLPILAIAVPVAAFTTNTWWVIAGALLWGAAVGIQESTLRAVVADLIAPERRASAYGLYAAVLGVATAGGGALTGYLYEYSISTLIIVVAVVQVLALVFLVVTTTRRRSEVTV
jgi:MFS family permease